MKLTIPVLSLWQPWASSMALLDKQVETRGWYAKHRGLFAIHAAKKWDADVRPLLDEPQFTTVRETYPDGPPLGGVVALSLLVDCLPGEKFLGRPGFVGSLEHALGLYEDPGKRRYGFDTAGTLRLEPFIPLAGRQQPFFPWEVEAETFIAAAAGRTCLVNPERTILGCLHCGHTLPPRPHDDGSHGCPRCLFVHPLSPLTAA